MYKRITRTIVNGKIIEEVVENIEDDKAQPWPFDAAFKKMDDAFQAFSDGFKKIFNR